MILGAGVHSISAADYHADPLRPNPSLSSSIVRILLNRSPIHARHAHPVLNKAYSPRPPTDVMEWGSIVHKLFLGEGSQLVEIDAPDWRGKKEQLLRSEAREAGKLPVLSRRLVELEKCAAAAREQIKAYPDIVAALSAGKPEQAIVWREGDIWCRALVDWLPTDESLPLIDLKTTGDSAAPQTWERRLITEYAVQSAFYLRGLKAVRGRAPDDVRFIVVELDPPHALSVLSPSSSLLALANEMVDEALATWAECLRTGRWPSYPAHVCWVDPPSWAITQHEERRVRAEWMREQRATDGEVYHKLYDLIGGPPS